jgi:DNA adenine methylase
MSPVIKPFVKWAGGKKSLLPILKPLMPSTIEQYYEPFIGGGALFFASTPQRATISDLNFDLINCYSVIKNNPIELMAQLDRHLNNHDYYYAIRSLDRSFDFNYLDKIKRAARFIYLNKCCYNGLHRTNKLGQFNSPYGKNKSATFYNRENILAISSYLTGEGVSIETGSYEIVLRDFSKGDFIYLDPPYYPVTDSSFTQYNGASWGSDDQLRLRNFCDTIDLLGGKFMLSNSDCPLIRNLYRDYKITALTAKRSINSVASGRGAVSELVIMNY